jgi:hypothetical protein
VIVVKVRCVDNKASAIPEGKRRTARLQDDYAFRISIGEQYTVYAVSVFHGLLWYCICDDGYVYYPAWTPAELFEIEDGRVSRYWNLAANTTSEAICTLAFPEWLQDECSYYDDLLENLDSATEIWNRYKTLIDEEAN